MEPLHQDSDRSTDHVLLPLIAPYISGKHLALLAGVCKGFVRWRNFLNDSAQSGSIWQAAYNRDIRPYEGYYATVLPEGRRNDARLKYLWYLRRNLLIEPSWKKVVDIGGEQVLGRFGTSSASFMYKGQSAALMFRWVHPNLTSAFQEKGTPRAFHSATYFPNKKTGAPRVLMFGGLSDGVPLNTLESVELKLAASSSSNPGDYPHTWHWKQVSTLGTPPIPRYGHSATLCGLDKTKLVIIGGCHCHNLHDYNSVGRELQDVHILDLSKSIPTWSELDMRGFIPMYSLGRLHNAVQVGPQILCFGGGPTSKLTNDVVAVNIYDQTWKQIEMEGQEPCPRQESFMAPIEAGSEMVMFGGRNKKTLGDCYILRLGGFKTREYAFSGCNLKPGYDEAEDQRREERRMKMERERKEREKKEKLRIEKEKEREMREKELREKEQLKLKLKEKLKSKTNKKKKGGAKLGEELLAAVLPGAAATSSANLDEDPEAAYRRMMNSILIRSVMGQYQNGSAHSGGGCSCSKCQQPNMPEMIKALDAEEEEEKPLHLGVKSYGRYPSLSRRIYEAIRQG
ncbi:hypothetical protein GUITHDRAFT_139430 [Guillardia theta CCMP2712]|uniref:Uncharacterized protein n=1 Tax=Guillardia theta (strain CCMP2712) TaxID=905079 RepID=L1J9Q5_GUITC|nr:hypothetical protein GUITHDRAFT_139430 [Guillardia theta CCMP2712]EKX44805.1 hypothetical protein GUITHDRAFT_139430 [Guillardia theta CCMP2712]|eukprot:XP_005831785.1 hypothetical protein GUITHDRAFT_139430 [Guillardia theta CCMP2712]